MTSAASPEWIQRLLDPSAYPHPVQQVRLIETHISWLLLTGTFAYKIKKPVDLGFVDFQSLDRRRFFCEEEIRLNGRLAPDLYLNVATVTGSLQQPEIDGSGPVFDYAVRMQQFRDDQLLSRLAAESRLTTSHVDQLADQVSRFHCHIDAAPTSSRHSQIENVITAALANFRPVKESCDPGLQNSVAALEEWTKQEFDRLSSVFQERADAGRIRECHGDMHLGNIYVDPSGQVVVFDGIEFSERLRWIDVVSEVAFTMMDLLDRGYPHLAWRYVNRWLETTGDFNGLTVLRFYLVYRALVRAKVNLIRAHQTDVEGDQQQTLVQDAEGYIRLATGFLHPSPPILVITCGPSGSGKTFGTQTLIEQRGMVRVRSDVERKRLAGLAATDSSHSAPDSGLYSHEASAAVYSHLLQVARQILGAGRSVVVDATFLKRADRHRFAELAAELQVSFLILRFTATPEVLKQRILLRNQRGHDASEATSEIVDRQLQIEEPLTEDEMLNCIDAADIDLAAAIAARLNLIQEHSNRQL